MERLPVLDHRLSLLRKRLRVNGIKVTGDSPAWSEVQTILARGDTSLASVLANVRETTLAAWNEAVRTARIDVDALAHQPMDAGPHRTLAHDRLGGQPEPSQTREGSGAVGRRRAG